MVKNLKWQEADQLTINFINIAKELNKGLLRNNRA